MSTAAPIAAAAPPEAAVLTTADRNVPGSRPPMVAGGVLSGPGDMLALWIPAYNGKITAGAAPKDAASHAVRTMLFNATMHDLGQIGYFPANSDDPGNPDGFNFNIGQLFPQPTGELGEAVVYLQLAASIISYLYPPLAVLLELAVVVIDIINWLIGLFSGKPRAEDTQLVAQRFMTGHNPASYIVGVQLLRNLSQNNIVLSSSDAGDQAILGDIRRQGEEMIVAQGQTQAFAQSTIDYVWGSANQSNFVLPDYLKTDPTPIPPSPTPPPPPPPPPPGGGQQGPCPPYSSLPGCLPAPPGYDTSTDEPDNGFTQVGYWLSIIAIYMMNLFEAIEEIEIPGAQPGNSDPVTCTQLTAQVALINAQLTAIATAIGAIAPSAPTPTDLTAVVAALNAIAAAIAAQPAQQPIDLSHLNAWADMEVSNQAAALAFDAADSALDAELLESLLLFSPQGTP